MTNNGRSASHVTRYIAEALTHMSPLFLIPSAYAILGFLYSPGAESLIALIYIIASSLPLSFVNPPTRNDQINICKHTIWILPILSLTIGALNLIIIAQAAGYTGFEILDIDGISRIATQSTINRYEVDTEANSGNPILLAVSLFIVFSTKYIDKGLLKTSVTVAPIIAYSILTTEKWPTFLALIFLVAAEILSPSIPKRQSLLKMVALLSVVIIAMVFSLVLRSGNDNPAELVDIFCNYLFAQYYGFGQWLGSSRSESLSFGAASFMGPLNQMGLLRREAGSGFESYTLHGIESNIYTAYRYIILDFGLLSPLVINSIFACVIYIFSKTHACRANAFIYTLLLLSSLLSLNVTLFIHNSTALAAILCSTLVCATHKKKAAINECP